MGKTNEEKLLEEIFALADETDEKPVKKRRKTAKKEDKPHTKDTFDFEREFRKALSKLTVEKKVATPQRSRNPKSELFMRRRQVMKLRQYNGNPEDYDD